MQYVYQYYVPQVRKLFRSRKLAVSHGGACYSNHTTVSTCANSWFDILPQTYINIHSRTDLDGETEYRICLFLKIFDGLHGFFLQVFNDHHAWIFVIQNIYKKMNVKDHRVLCPLMPLIRRFDNGLFRVHVQISNSCPIWLWICYINVYLFVCVSGNNQIIYSRDTKIIINNKYDGLQFCIVS